MKFSLLQWPITKNCSNRSQFQFIYKLRVDNGCITNSLVSNVLKLELRFGPTAVFQMTWLDLSPCPKMTRLDSTDSTYDKYEMTRDPN